MRPAHRCQLQVQVRERLAGNDRLAGCARRPDRLGHAVVALLDLGRVRVEVGLDQVARETATIDLRAMPQPARVQEFGDGLEEIVPDELALDVFEIVNHPLDLRAVTEQGVHLLAQVVARQAREGFKNGRTPIAPRPAPRRRCIFPTVRGRIHSGRPRPAPAPKGDNAQFHAAEASGGHLFKFTGDLLR